MMKNIFYNLKKTIQTELIKKKGSGIVTLSFIIGIIVPLISFIIPIVSFFLDEKKVIGIPVNYYFEILKFNLVPFANFFFPLLLIVSASKIAQIDHKNRGWHFMEMQPITKFSIFFAKFGVLLYSSLLAITVFLVSTVLFTWLLTVFIEIPSDKILTLPIEKFVRVGVRLCIASISVISIQYVLSVLISSFIWPIIIGFLSMIVPLILKNFSITLNWYPYQFLSEIATYPTGSDFGYWFTFSERVSILYSIVFLYIGFNWYRFKTFFSAFFSSKIKIGKLLAFLVIAGLLIAFALQPTQQKKWNRTVITGKVSSDKKVLFVYLFDKIVQDTIAKIPIQKDNTFKYVFDDTLQADNYLLQIDYFKQANLYFGDKDSLFINFKLFGRKDDLKITGNRISENRASKNNRNFNFIEYYLKNNINLENTSFYMKIITEGWEKSLSKIKLARTVDNLSPRKDYLLLKEKEISMKYFSYWKEFQKKRNTLLSDKEYLKTSKIIELENSISLADTKMLSNNDYLNFILSEFTKKDKREVIEAAKNFTAIAKLPKGLLKDKLLFVSLQKSLKSTTNNNVRDSLIDTYIGSIERVSYKNLLLKKYKNFNRLSKGEPAPNFTVYDVDAKKYTLESFKGKLLVIDCWATWCSPCLREAPHFERKAFKYKNKAIRFISISSDKNKENWLVGIKGKSKQVLQLRPKDLNEIKIFGTSYAINSIPRFILIDKSGKIINVNFIRPSNKSFDDLIDGYLK